MALTLTKQLEMANQNAREWKEKARHYEAMWEECKDGILGPTPSYSSGESRAPKDAVRRYKEAVDYCDNLAERLKEERDSNRKEVARLWLMIRLLSGNEKAFMPEELALFGAVSQDGRHPDMRDWPKP